MAKSISKKKSGKKIEFDKNPSASGEMVLLDGLVFIGSPKDCAIGYGTWIIQNCITATNGFRMPPDWSNVISNEEAYEMYLESLKK